MHSAGLKLGEPLENLIQILHQQNEEKKIKLKLMKFSHLTNKTHDSEY